MQYIIQDLITGAKVGKCGTLQNLGMPVGQDYSQPLRLVSPTDKTPIDITGNTYTGKIRKADGTLIATLTVAVSDGEDGRLLITLAKAITETLTSAAGVHDYDIFRTDAGESTMVIKGKIEIISTATYYA